MAREQKLIFLWKNWFCFFLVKVKKCYFCWNWVFGPFLAIWFSDIFLTWLENKKWFFSQKNHFLFSERPVLVGLKMGYSNIPKLLWIFMLLRPNVQDFHLSLFRLPRGSPLTLHWSFAPVLTFYPNLFWDSVHPKFERPYNSKKCSEETKK